MLAMNTMLTGEIVEENNDLVMDHVMVRSYEDYEPEYCFNSLCKVLDSFIFRWHCKTYLLNIAKL